jgi:hypothetical protein
MDIDGHPGQVLDVIDADAVPSRLEQDLYSLFPANLVRPECERARFVEESRDNCDQVQLRAIHQGVSESPGYPCRPEVLVF